MVRTAIKKVQATVAGGDYNNATAAYQPRS